MYGAPYAMETPNRVVVLEPQPEAYVQPLFPDGVPPLAVIAQLQVYQPLHDPNEPGGRSRTIRKTYGVGDRLHEVDDARIGDDCGSGAYEVAARNSTGQILGWAKANVSEAFVEDRKRRAEAWVSGGTALPSAAPSNPSPHAQGQDQAPVLVETPNGFVAVKGLEPMAQALMVIYGSLLAQMRADTKHQIEQIVEMHKATLSARPAEATGSDVAFTEFRRIMQREREDMQQLREQYERERRSNTQLAVQNAHVTAERAAPSTIAQVVQTTLENAPQLLSTLKTLVEALASAAPPGAPAAPSSPHDSGVFPAIAAPTPLKNGHNGHGAA